MRATSYVYPTVSLSDAQAAAYEAAGFEVALHVNTDCANWTPSSLEGFYSDQLGAFAAKYTSVPAPATNRTHCIAWSDYTTQPQVELAHGIRLDTNYYYWPPGWIQNRPGMFTGSGMPMRFANADGTMIDVYQATTQITDESGQDIPFNINALLNRALGPQGYYGVFTANMHTDSASHAGSDAIVASALANDVPVVSARQMLDWLDGRNSSSFGALAWNAGTLTFTIQVGAGANGLRAMLPTSSATGQLTGIERGGNAVAFTTETIKGVSYAIFEATAGSYAATYGVDQSGPAISDVSAVPDADGTATITWTTNEAADSEVVYGTDQGALNSSETDAALVTSHSIELTGLAPNTTYYYRVKSADGAGNETTSPLPATRPSASRLPRPRSPTRPSPTSPPATLAPARPAPTPATAR